MCWEQWVAKFEELEQKHYGYKLDGEGRHSTLYDLFKDGYAPERAFKKEEVERMSSDVVIKKGSAIGIIHFKRSERREGQAPCKCCPGEPGHIFSRGVEFGPFEDIYPEHFGHGVQELLGSVALNDNRFEGKRVRVTVEVLEND